MIYDICICEKLKIWAKNRLSIEAETKEDAIQKAVEMIKNGNLNDGFDDNVLDEYEMMYETSEGLTPDENNGEATVEVWHNREVYWTNADE